MVKVMSSKLSVQLPFEIVHRTTALVPVGTPVMVVLVLLALVMVAVPPCKLHKPVPSVGVLADMVKVLVLHWVMSTPASAVVGLLLLVRTTSSKLSVHTPLLMVQRKVALVPAGTRVIPLVSLVGVVMVAEPLVTVHRPVPVTAVLPAKVKLPLAHCS